MRWFTWCLIACLLLEGCGSIPMAGVEPDGIGRYSNIVVVPLLSDIIRVEPSDKEEFTWQNLYMTGWATRDKAIKIVEELFAGSDTSVRGISEFKGRWLLPRTPDLSEWASVIVQKLHESNLVRDDEIVFLLRQNAIDEHGRQYSPFRDFFLSVYTPYSPSRDIFISGAVGVILGFESRAAIYQPFFYLTVNTGFEKTMEGASLCSIGFDAAIFNVADTTCIADAKNILGQEKLPDDSFRNVGWEKFNEEERIVAEMYCISALRRALSVTINRLQLMTPRK